MLWLLSCVLFANTLDGVPLQRYPDLKRPLGKPLGAATKKGTVYVREFEHASAFVDLSDRRKSKVTWK
jgi:hypothetical protein